MQVKVMPSIENHREKYTHTHTEKERERASSNSKRIIETCVKRELSGFNKQNAAKGGEMWICFKQ